MIKAFTLLELLATITIILLLSGLSLAAANLVSASTKRTKTSLILSHVLIGIEKSAINTQINLSGITHPLAASAEPRPPFIRADTSITALRTTSDGWEALSVQNINWVNEDARDRVLLDSDIYADPDVPLLYGIERAKCSILGASSRWVTSYRNLPSPIAGTPYAEGAISNPTLRTPYDNTIYPDKWFLIRPATTVWKGATTESFTLTQFEIVRDASELPFPGLTAIVDSEWSDAWGKSAQSAFQTALSSEIDNLASLGAIKNSTSTQLPLLTKSESTIHGNRIRRDTSAPFSRTFKPGTLRTNDGNWIRYRINGPCLYDAYGQEIIVYRLPNGSLQAESAGPDGVLRWLPPQSGYPPTFKPNATDPVSGVKNGALDNIKGSKS